MVDVKQLQIDAKEFSLLYVEDNASLRANAGKLLRKFFTQVDVAEDGLVGLELFKKNHYALVITDIKMPKMDGLELSAKISLLRPETKIIVMSAFDDKDSLMKFIEVGIFRFLKKPVNITELTTVLSEALKDIKHERDTRLFYSHLQSVFNYQSSMVVMLDGTQTIFANQMFLDFFGLQSIEEFAKSVESISQKFMPHDGFLYEGSTLECLETLRLNEKKLFHIKMQNVEDSIRHFIVKYQNIPEKEGRGILSFEDITELNLLKLFDEKETSNDASTQNQKALFDLLEVIQRNSAKIELHNYYKGLSITNDAVITDINKNSIVVKTTYLQQKAIQFEQKTIIVSQALPKTLACSTIINMSFDKQSVTLGGLSFVNSSPVTRKTIRVVPDEKQSASLFIGENKFPGEVSIEDISLDAVKLKLNALPAGFDKGSNVIVDLVLELDKRPLILNMEATLYRKSESRHSFSVVFLFKETKKSELVKYITKRQMAIIREFKGLQNG